MTVEKLITDHIDIWSSALQTRSAAGRGSNGKIDLYGIKKLRELILELAVRGKLVPQDPNDEPASELLKRIAAEKAELVKQGKIKKQKPLPEISEGEKPFELPVGWEWARLGNTVAIIRGITFPASEKHKEPSEGKVACLRTANIQDSIEWDDLLYVSKSFVKRSEQFAEKGDIVMSMANSRELVGKVAYIYNIPTGSATFGGFLSVIRPYGFNAGFLMSVLRSPNIKSILIDSSSQTTNIANISLEKLNPLVILVPPVKEQNRIASKVEELMSLCDQLEQQSLLSLDAHQQLVETLLATLTDSQDTKELSDNWARISQYFGTLFTTEASIDALKQTILQLAVMGKLVPQDPNDEPAFELLKRIEQEKAELVKQGKIKKQKPLPPVSDEEKPFELPVGWGWVRLGDIGTISGGGTPSKNNEEYWLGDIPWLSPKDMKVDYISTAEFNISELAVANSSVRIIPNNSILFVVRGMILAHTFPVAINKKEVTINQDMKSITSHLFNMDFLLNLMKGMSRNVLSLVDRSSHGTCKLVSEKLFNLQIPLPPLSEQSRINNRIEELVSLCDTLKSRLQSAQQTQLHLADALTDAALN
ncbi:TPA: restriction endonuclease subunit S [Morganella morganii]|uniref:restriction endonuclease subunit S n=1 Tax=Morganella morganii TaxID=582 RepID=UPI0013A77B7D|nr:restriction endonuclease subunit S [Morganella morganii]HBZ7486658.1 restriction endonuclease subunit S [Klebsiella pneumoniae]MBT0307925.1 restriction endonuclease subunit S [Morganella morganii subsp. morganii]QIC10573.1 restriction endonuclease subunit S [Morganella morganii]HDS3053217.1 restriction endonuclease subunit S [Morganella morganii subsp. morganii]HDS7241908.1 restriction endonuclease subunit S [Morganella morganii subsp. morganii]